MVQGEGDGASGRGDSAKGGCSITPPLAQAPLPYCHTLGVVVQ